MTFYKNLLYLIIYLQQVQQQQEMSRLNKKVEGVNDGNQQVDQQSQASSKDDYNDNLRGHTFYDDSKLQAMTKFYTKLDEATREDQQNQKSIDSLSDRPTISFYRRYMKALMKSFFQSNHVILTYQAVTVPLYLIIILLEFTQVLFFIFYQIDVNSEFTNYVYIPNNSTSSSNQTNNDGTLAAILDESVLGQTQQTSLFHFFMVFEFMNFPMYTLGQPSSNLYLTLYVFMNMLFYFLIVLFFALSGRIFEDSRNENLKEGYKFLLKILSLLMILFLSVFQIPMTTLLFQGFQCNEDSTVDYTLPDIICGSPISTVLIIVSAIQLIIYYGFMLMQLSLYTSNDLDSTIPWSQFERRLSQVKMVYRLIFVMDFVFDKNAVYIEYIQLVCSILCLYVIYRRYLDSYFFKPSVHTVASIIEISKFTLLVSLAWMNLMDIILNITLIASIIILSFIFSLIFLLLLERRRVMTLSISQPRKMNVLRLENYFYRIFELINENTRENNFMIEGIYSNHMEQCTDQMCDCQLVNESLCDIKKFRKAREERESTLVSESSISRSQFSNVGSRVPSAFLGSTTNVLEDLNGRINILSPIRFNAQVSNIIVQPPASFELRSPTEEARVSDKATQAHGHIEEESYDERKPLNPVKQQKLYYKFLTVKVYRAIAKHAKAIELRLFNSFLQKSKLNNHFKAIFELINCEQCSPTMHQKFIIFRRKIEIQQMLIKQHIRNIQSTSCLDVLTIFNYEKQEEILTVYRETQKYQLNEYLAVNAALGFWRELLQKHFKSSSLQEKGFEISRCFSRIQDCAKELQKICPDDIKFLFKYGVFLITIVNNEFDALECFKQAQTVYQTRLTKRQNNAPSNELTHFAWNSSGVIIVMSASAYNFGNMIHINEEIEPMLGYQRKQLVGKNVNCITPQIIRKKHDEFIKRYLDTGRVYVVEKQRQEFAINSHGYLQEIELLIKVYPYLTGEILFVGFIQKSEAYTRIEQPKNSLKGLEQHYIMTDDKGYITNISEGLFSEMGLNSKFFEYDDTKFETMINLQNICPSLFDEEAQELLEQDGGFNFAISTSNIISSVDLEKLSSDEILELRASIGEYQAQFQRIRLHYDKVHCAIHVYRVIIINIARNANDQNSMMNFMKPNNNNSTEDYNKSQKMTMGFKTKSSASDDINEGSMSMGSTSSAISNASAEKQFNSLIKNFKQTLGERKDPKNLVILDRLIIIILLAMIILSSLDFHYLVAETSNLLQQNLINMYSELRLVYIILIGTSIRSLLDVTNLLEYDQHYSFDLDVFESRTENGERSIVMETVWLEMFEYNITQNRLNVDGDSNELQSEFEDQNIQIINLDNNEQMSFTNQSFRTSMVNFISSVNWLNATEPPDLQLQIDLLLTQPFQNISTQFGPLGTTTQREKTSYFLLVNALRQLRTKSVDALTYLHQNSNVEEQQIPFLIIMVVGITLMAASIIGLLILIWQIERIQGDILSLYAHLQSHNISQVYLRCSNYMNHLNEGSLISMICDDAQQKQEVNNTTQAYNAAINIVAPQQNNKRPIDDYSEELSEEEKEERQFQNQIVAKKYKKTRQQKEQNPQNNFQGQNLYTQMIKKTFQVIRDSQEIDNIPKNSMSQFGSEIRALQARSKKEAKKKKPFAIIENPDQNNSKANFGKKFGVSNKEVTFKRGISQEIKYDADVEEDKKSSDSSDSISKKKKRRKSVTIQEAAGAISTEQENVEQRKKQFAQTLKTQNLCRRLGFVIIGLVLCAYFVQAFVFQIFFKNDLQSFQQGLPILLNRYRYIMLAFGLMKERILYNNSLNSYEYDPVYGHDIDLMYFDSLVQNENALSKLKLNHSPIMNELVSYYNQQDSSDFCPVLIRAINDTHEVTLFQVFDIPGLTLADAKSYQSLLDTEIAACTAAFFGNTDALILLKQKGVNLDLPDWDLRTPLMYAIIGNQTATAQYLVNQGSNVNALDRWGNTPLARVQSNNDILQLLTSKGGVMVDGLSLPFQCIPLGQLTMNITDMNYRLFYASRYNDVNTLQILKELGWNLDAKDIDGRTPLHVAAAQGNQEAVQYLIRFGAPTIVLDSHCMYPVDNAQYFNHYSVHFFMDMVTTSSFIKTDCISFGGGLLAKGVQQAVSVWSKDFTDIQMNITSKIGNFAEMLEIVRGPQWQRDTGTYDEINMYPFSLFQLYDQFQEIYLWRLLIGINMRIQDSLTTYISSYSSQIQIVFIVFLAFQLLALFVLRRVMLQQMKNDIFESRGILNLIPNHIIEQNRVAVESIIQKLKN